MRRILPSGTIARTLLFLMKLAAFSSLPSILPASGQDCWVYFGTYTAGSSRGIYVSRLAPEGKLGEPQLAAASTNPSFLAIAPSHRFLYAINELAAPSGKKQADAVAYELSESSGRLAKINEQPSGCESLCHLSLDPTGGAVLVASYGGGSVTAFPARPDGGLGPATSFIQHRGSSLNPKSQLGPHAHCIATDPGGRFALACDLGLDQVLIYRLDSQAATLAAHVPAFAPLAPGVGPRHLAFSPDGKFVYVVNEMGCSVTAFAYNAELGALSELQTISTLGAGQAQSSSLSGAEIAAHPSGKYLYTSTRGSDILSLFSVAAAGGKLTRVENVPSGGKTPRSFGIDPSGRFLLAANQGSDNVAVFRINPSTGQLTPTGQSLPIASPSCVVFAPAKPDPR